MRFIDLETRLCGVIDASGNVPVRKQLSQFAIYVVAVLDSLYTFHVFQVSRGGHSITLVGSRLFVFGGEDKNRRLLNDLHVLDLETMTWDVVKTT